MTSVGGATAYVVAKSNDSRSVPEPTSIEYTTTAPSTKAPATTRPPATTKPKAALGPARTTAQITGCGCTAGFVGTPITTAQTAGGRPATVVSGLNKEALLFTALDPTLNEAVFQAAKDDGSKRGAYSTGTVGGFAYAEWLDSNEDTDGLVMVRAVKHRSGFLYMVSNTANGPEARNFFDTLQ